jgi:glycosyltransferase involved in cell wall biosynthesis
MPELFFGGAETQFRLLVRGLVDAGCAVTVFVECSYPKENRRVDEAFMVELRGAVRFELFSGLYAHNGVRLRIVSSVKFRAAMARRLRARDIDVLIVYSGLGAQVVPAARRLGIATIYSERNAGNFSGLKWLTKGRFVRRATRVVANSPTAVGELQQRGIAAELIVNGVEPLKSTATPTHGNQPGLKVLVPARISQVKDQATVIAAVPALSGTVTEVVFAGAVEDQEYQERLFAAAEACSGATSVAFAGHVPDIREQYCRYDLVILASHIEGMPNVLLEAMDAGVLCIASDIPANRFVIRDPRFLFPAGNARGLARAVQNARSIGGAERCELIEANREWVRKNFSIGRMVAAYRNLILEARSRMAYVDDRRPDDANA